MNPAFFSPLRFKLEDVLGLRFRERRYHLRRRLQKLDTFHWWFEVFFQTTPTYKGIHRPQVHVDTGRLDLAGIHFCNNARLDRSPDLVGFLDRSQIRFEGIPRLPIGSKGFGSTISQEASFLEEGLIKKLSAWRSSAISGSASFGLNF
jgi:hypothetical protein